MTNISIELVPRSLQSLEAEFKTIKSLFPQINTINIPDLLRLDIRSWEACKFGKSYFENAIPHIRSMDFARDQEFPLFDFLDQNSINRILIVTGDKPQDLSRKIYPTSSVDLIRKIKRSRHDIQVYAAIDPYRNGFRDEFEYVLQKVDAGADGFFTQPFFDIRLMEIFAEQLEPMELYWGISPVLSPTSQHYWETRNNAIFPADFEPTLTWNQELAKRALSFARERQDNLYFMPIRASVEDYLNGIING